MVACRPAPPRQESRSRSSSVGSIPSTDDSDIYEWRPETRRSTPSFPSWDTQAESVVQFAPVGWVVPTAMGSSSWQFPNDYSSTMAGSWPPAALAVGSEAAEIAMAQVANPVARSESSSEETPTVDELRSLQRRLAEVTAKPSDKTSHHKRVRSNSSLSTMTSDCEDSSPWPTPSLRHALSSGSVSTLVSDILEDAHGEEGVEFGPIFEEELQAAVGESCGTGHSVAEAPHMQTDTKVPKSLDSVEEFSRLNHAKLSHSSVPKNFNLAEEFSRSNHEDPPTTMMIRNIPNRYTQRELIRELEALGFAGSFDFLYVPIDRATMCNVGYGFVNFVNHHWAMRCMQTFDGYPFKKYRKARGKIATVSIAHIQGLEANLRHYENLAVNGVVRSRQQRSPVLVTSAADTTLQL